MIMSPKTYLSCVPESSTLNTKEPSTNKSHFYDPFTTQSNHEREKTPYNIRNLNDAVFSNPLGTKQCKVSGVLYNHSQKILFTDHCKACICIDGQIFCYWQCEETAHYSTGEEIEDYTPSTSTANVISTTFETEESSKVTNSIPHSSPLDILQSTTISPNETTEPFCLVMGVRYQPGSVLPRDTGSCLECQCGRNSQITCSPKDCITLNSLSDEDTSEPEFYGNNNGEQNNGNFNLDMFAVNVV
ncbi:uncharacterized protein LOC112691591 isoform X2 [Sipha flava]|uniref:Uncharacterized protein LOC112691591 isoform X2 n=1 Tax=Sipha flava TaxID=143950 RepID=A0A2S2QSY4_9HEMI|nr:uncharacterized protein LOC112691591 isoform X2 [Sipha flava]